MLRIFSLVGGTNSPETSGVFDINRANKWVQALQLLPEHRHGEALSDIRYKRDSARRRSAARATPDLRFGYYKATDSSPRRSLARATPSQQQRDSGALLRPTDNNRPTITTPVTSPPARKISRRREHHTAEPPTFGETSS